MFSVLRFILIVGAIFYYSPVRQEGSGTFLDTFLTPKKSEPAPAAAPQAETSGQLETVWRALPDSAKQAVVGKILTTSGLGVTSTETRDTLQPEDRQPAWRGDAPKPRT
jgi:hypothetical protein